MAVPADSAVLKTAADIQIWLGTDVSGRLSADTEAVAHGGTALTLLGVKESTKAANFSFRDRADFDRFHRALERLGYRVSRTFVPRAGEEQLRLEHGSSRVDVVDIRFPIWNNWRLTRKVLARSRTIPFGRVRLVLLDLATVVLFKTYPLRDSDLDDLRTVVDTTNVDESRVVALFDEQDAIHRAELGRDDVEHEPLFNVLDLRTRLAGTMRLLGPGYRRRLARIDRHAREKFNELGLDASLVEIVGRIRDPDRVLDWDAVLDDRGDDLRRRLASGSRTGGGSGSRGGR